MQRYFKLSLFLCAFIRLLFSKTFIHSQGVDLCNSIETVLIKEGFSIETQALCQSEAFVFPRNIIISLPQKAIRESSKVGNVDSVILSITQQFAWEQKELFLDFLNKLRSAPFSFDVSVVLMANDDINIFPRIRGERALHPTGTRVFTQSLGTADNTCAIVVTKENSDSKISRIIPGGGGDIAPLYLVKAVKNASKKTDIVMLVPNSANFLYRLRFIGENERVSSFLGESIPAIGVSVHNTAETYNMLVSTLDILSTHDTSVWDRHYAHIDLFPIGGEFWIDEVIFFLCYLLITVFVLFVVSFFSVSNDIRHIAAIRDFSRTWYLFPLLIAFTTAMLFLSQKIIGKATDNPVILLGIKLVVMFTISLILFRIQTELHTKISFAASGFAMLIIAAANVFIFCTVDLSFLFVFAFEYLVCFIMQPFHRPLQIVLTLLIMMVPYIPAASNILISSNPQALWRFGSPSLGGNLLIALIIFPFQMEYQRLFLLMAENKSKHQTSSIIKKTLKGMLVILIIVSIFAAIYFSLFTFLVKTGYDFKLLPQPRHIEHSESDFINNDGPAFVKPTLTADSFLDYKIHHICLHSDAAKVLRYTVSIESKDDVPVYECDYDYTLASSKQAYILIPDFPASDVNISYHCSGESKSTITITSYVETEKGTKYIETCILQSEVTP